MTIEDIRGSVVRSRVMVDMQRRAVNDIRGSVVRIRVMVDMHRRAVSIMLGGAARRGCGRPRSRPEVASSAV